MGKTGRKAARKAGRICGTLSQSDASMAQDFVVEECLVFFLSDNAFLLEEARLPYLDDLHTWVGAVFLKFRFCAFKLGSIVTRMWFLLYSACWWYNTENYSCTCFLLHGDRALMWAGNWSDFPWAPQDSHKVLICFFHVLFLLCGVFVVGVFFPVCLVGFNNIFLGI